MALNFENYFRYVENVPQRDHVSWALNRCAPRVDAWIAWLKDRGAVHEFSLECTFRDNKDFGAHGARYSGTSSGIVQIDAGVMPTLVGVASKLWSCLQLGDSAWDPDNYVSNWDDMGRFQAQGTWDPQKDRVGVLAFPLANPLPIEDYLHADVVEIVCDALVLILLHETGHVFAGHRDTFGSARTMEVDADQIAGFLLYAGLRTGAAQADRVVVDRLEIARRLVRASLVCSIGFEIWQKEGADYHRPMTRLIDFKDGALRYMDPEQSVSFTDQCQHEANRYWMFMAARSGVFGKYVDFDPAKDDADHKARWTVTEPMLRQLREAHADERLSFVRF